MPFAAKYFWDIEVYKLTNVIWFVVFVVTLVGLGCVWYGLHRQSLKSCCAKLTGYDIPAAATGAGKDGTSAFIALATFALAEGGALTAVARGEDRTNIVLTIYTIVVGFTAGWIVCLLRSKCGKVHAYDATSLRYGRISLAWTGFLGLIMVFLGANQLLPNQTHRAEYPRGLISVTPLHFSNVARGDLVEVPGTEQERQYLDGWLHWLKSDVPGQRLVWIEQEIAFQDYYKQFRLKLTYADNKFKIMGRVAFLVSSDNGTSRPVYRQVQFEPVDTATWDSSDVLAVPPCDPGESLILLVYVTPIGDEELPEDASAYDFALTKD